VITNQAAAAAEASSGDYKWDGAGSAARW